MLAYLEINAVKFNETFPEATWMSPVLVASDLELSSPLLYSALLHIYVSLNHTNAIVPRANLKSHIFF